MAQNIALQGIKAHYSNLLQKYASEAEEVENIHDLYSKFRSLKIYEAEYDKHEELKKQMQFWNNPNFNKKSQNQQQLQAELHQLLQLNQQIKMQILRKQ